MSSTNQPSLRRRPSRVVPASITAVVLLVIGVAAVAAVVGRLATGSVDRTTGTVLGWLSGLHWNGSVMLTATVIAIIVGIVLIIAAVRPGRRELLQLDSNDRLDVVMPRRALGRLLVARAGAVDGVDHVDVDVKEHGIVVQATTATRYTDDVKQQVSAAVEQALTETGLQRTPRCRVAVRQV